MKIPKLFRRGDKVKVWIENAWQTATVEVGSLKRAYCVFDSIEHEGQPRKQWFPNAFVERNV